MMDTVKRYVSREVGFAAFVITVILCTILAALALLSVAGSYMGLATGWIPTGVRQLGLYAALLLTIFFLAGELIRDIN
jgi:low affinity Fe/Cu permease